MASFIKSTFRESIEIFIPNSVKNITKKIYLFIIRSYSKYVYIKKSGYVEFGYWFRFTRTSPYIARVGSNTITDRNNIWNAKSGNIDIGDNCWFGLNNIIMGPVHIGNNTSTGPNVSILGPRHPALDKSSLTKDKTSIGNNVWISTGSIIVFGVTIGDNAIIGPGSVVSKDVPEGAFFSGNPARDLTKIAGKLWKMENIVQERFKEK
jgi:maltose O-acetyltransferase